MTDWFHITPAELHAVQRMTAQQSGRSLEPHFWGEGKAALARNETNAWAITLIEGSRR